MKNSSGLIKVTVTSPAGLMKFFLNVEPCMGSYGNWLVATSPCVYLSSHGHASCLYAPYLCMDTWLFSAIHCGWYGIYDRWNRPYQITLDSSLTEFYFKWFALEFVLNILPVTVGYILNVYNMKVPFLWRGWGSFISQN